jgi:nucleoside-diphosphate-sugar epimerase
MKILMIGGTGIISSGVTHRLLEEGHDVSLLNRGTRPELTPPGVTQRIGDMADEAGIAGLLAGGHFDAVVDWMVYTPDEAARDIRLFAGKTDHYVFISSGSAYRRPARSHIVTEQTPLENPFSPYARNKAASEAVFLQAVREQGFPATIVRPSLTYGDICIPYVLNSWHKPWTLIDRMRRGKRIIVPGDGTSLWEITHNEDFARGFTGLLGNPDTIGEAFHITSGEVMTWEAILETIAEAAGLHAQVAHVSSEFLCAFMPEEAGSLFGDKISSVIYDNSKIKRFVPGFEARVPFREGIARTIAYLQAHPERQQIDAAYNDKLDRVLAAHDAGMAMAHP